MENKRLIVASGNPHKIEEIKDILKDLPIEVFSKDEVGLKDLEVIEDKATLEENAIKKAKEISKRTEGIVIADDTGLFVDKLNERPGIYSARYAGENATYQDNNKKLLKELEEVSTDERTARFKTVIALVINDSDVRTLYGECEGKIAFSPKGDKGFGYDPLFIVKNYAKTFAELGEEVKNKISHRAKALKKLREELENILKDE